MSPPHAPLLYRNLRSSAQIWLLARIMYAFVFFVGAQIFSRIPTSEVVHTILHPVLPVRILLVVIAVGLVQLDRRFAHERLLQANFGVSEMWFIATSLVGATVSDVVMQTLLFRV